MKQTITYMFLLFFLSTSLIAQNIVKGVVKDNDSEKLLQNVSVSVKGIETVVTTDLNGNFTIKNLPEGKQIVAITKEGYETQVFPVNLLGKPVDLGIVFMYSDKVLEDQQDLSIITISDDELSSDESSIDNVSGLLQASRDAYLRTAAFDFSSSFYRIRGLDSDNGTVIFNGIEMNKIFNGRPQWSNWGGLNNVTRNQEFSNFLSPSSYTFGGILGATYINSRPSEQRAGTRISYASSNRSYVHRVMGSYATGLRDDGWSFVFSGSRRAAEEGFVDGTSYNAFSLYGSMEKKIGNNHALNLTSIYASNRRGRASSNSQEVFDLKGNKYNPYWGYQNGEIRNSRIREVIEPIFILNHYWDINEKSTLQTSLGYQFGQAGSSRIDFNGANINPDSGFPEGSATNPDPSNYRKLPSYGLSLNDVELAYGLQQQFLNDGQLDWNSLYQENIDSANRGENAINVLYEDRVDDKLFTANTVFNSALNHNISFTGSVNYKKLKSENFANVLDLFGGTGFLDVDTFANDLLENPERVQNNVLNPNRVVVENEKFKYDYNIYSDIISGFVQGQFKFKKVDFYAALTATQTNYQREGFYQNGGFLDSSLGKGEKQSFTGLGGKGGLTYKLTGRHLFDFNGAYFTKAPTIRNTYANSRENHATVPNSTEEKIMSFDANYILRSPTVQAKLSGFYAKIQDANEVSFFFVDGISDEGVDDTTAFVQEILQGVDKQHFGGELAIEVKVTPTIKLKGVAAVGQYTYDNNPDLYIASEDFIPETKTATNNELLSDFGLRSFGEATLKNYKLASGPQRAFSIGLEYRDPKYWWVGVTANFLSNAYVDISAIQRSANFYADPTLTTVNEETGETNFVPFNDYDAEEAKELLQQEKFDSYMVANLVGGKSWRIKGKYVSVFASINNLLNTTYKTGGFENGRNANFRELKEDNELDVRLFGNKYWYGRGTTYFLNVNFSL